MPEARRATPTSGPEIESVQKSAPDKYFKLILTVMLFTGMYPMSSERSFFLRLLYSTYFGLLFIFIIVLTPVSRAIALFYLTNIDDLTENVSFLMNHIIAVFKIGIFMKRRNDLMRLVETIQGKRFRHKDCGGEKFSANRLISKAVRNTNAVSYAINSFVACFLLSTILKTTTITKRSEEIISDSNGTGSEEIHLLQHRPLPFHGWYPFSTKISPNYEIVFVYQIITIFIVGQMVMALDTMVISFTIHIKVQFQILSHNLRFIKSHAKNTLKNISAVSADTVFDESLLDETSDYFIKTLELDLERHIRHHKGIIRLSQDLESVFTYQLLFQFVCSLITIGMLMWQLSSTPIFSAKFASMFFYFGAVSFQIFMYCWFGNEVMLESLSVADAAWDSGWNEISSRRFCYGISMIIHRSQNVIMITAGGFADLTLETYMTISRAAYSCFAVLKNIDN